MDEFEEMAKDAENRALAISILQAKIRYPKTVLVKPKLWDTEEDAGKASQDWKFREKAALDDQIQNLISQIEE